MERGDVFTRINREYYQLTGAEKKIADYILLQRQECQFMSISEMAEVVEVAEATVSRFCRRLGYKGYSAFKLAVAGAGTGTGIGQEPMDPLCGEITAQDSVDEMCRKLCATDVDAITQTLAMIDPAAITAAADMILAADQVLCMGLGGSAILARGAAHLFSTVLPNFHSVDDPHNQAIRTTLLTQRDVILYFSYSGSTRDMVDLLRMARARGVGIILVTRFPRSPGAALADVVLECGAKEGPLQLVSVAVRMGQFFLIDVLFNEVCRRNAEEYQERRRQAAEVLVDKHL